MGWVAVGASQASRLGSRTGGSVATGGSALQQPGKASACCQLMLPGRPPAENSALSRPGGR